MADEAAQPNYASQPNATAPQTPKEGSTPPASSPSPAPSGEQDPEYAAYLEQFKAHKATQPKAKTKKTGKNSYEATTPMTTSAAGSSPTSSSYNKPLTVGPNGPVSKKKPKIKSVGGKDAKKTGDNKLELNKGTEFNIDQPLSYEDWKNLQKNRAEQEAAKAKEKAARLQKAKDAGASEQEAVEYALDESSPAEENFDGWKQRRAREAADQAIRYQKAKDAGANNEMAKRFAKEANDDEEYNDWLNNLKQELEAAKNADDAAKAAQAVGDEPEAKDEEPAVDEPEEEPEIEFPEAIQAPTIAPASTAAPQQRQVAPGDQAATANQLAAQKAKDRGAENAANPPTSATPSLKDRAKNAAQKLNPVQMAQNAKQGAIDTINQKGRPLKQLANFKRIRKLNREIRDIDNKLRNFSKELKKPRAEINRIESKRRHLHAKLVFLKFMRLTNVVLDFIVVGEITTVPTELAIKSAKKEILAVKNQLLQKKKEIKAKVEEEKQLVELRKQKYQEKEKLSQLIPQKQAANDNGQQQNTEQAPPQAKGGGMPWNAPNDLNQNAVANDNASPQNSRAAAQARTSALNEGILNGLASQPANDNATRVATPTRTTLGAPANDNGITRADKKAA